MGSDEVCVPQRSSAALPFAISPRLHLLQSGHKDRRGYGRDRAGIMNPETAPTSLISNTGMAQEEPPRSPSADGHLGATRPPGYPLNIERVTSVGGLLAGLPPL